MSLIKSFFGIAESNNTSQKENTKMKPFRAFTDRKDHYITEKYYQDANCWYELDTMKLIKDNPVWDFSKRIVIGDYDIIWLYDNHQKNRIELKNLKHRGNQVLYNSDLNSALKPLKTILYCPESNQTVTLSRENLILFCSFLREEEIEEELRKEQEEKNEAKQRRNEEIEKKKELIKNKHMIAMGNMSEELMRKAINNPDTMPAELKKDYDNYIKILESIRLEKENKEEL